MKKKELRAALYKGFERIPLAPIDKFLEETETLRDLYKDEAVYKVCYSVKKGTGPITTGGSSTPQTRANDPQDQEMSFSSSNLSTASKTSHSAAVFIKRLPFCIQEEELREVYSQYGLIKNISIKRFKDHIDATAKISYIDNPLFNSEESTRHAIAATNGKPLFTRNSKVILASRYGDKKIKQMAKKKR